MENCLLIAANVTSFNEQEKDEIIKAAVCNYLKKANSKLYKKVPLLSEELSDDKMSEEVEAAALATNNSLLRKDSNILLTGQIMHRNSYSTL